MNRTPVVAAIIALTILIALLDFRNSPQLLASILFTFPIALCAMQRSKGLLWSTAAAAILFSIAAWAMALARGQFLQPWAASQNRGLLIASLLTLTILIHLWIDKSHKVVLDAATLERQSNSLTATNEELEVLRTEAPAGIGIGENTKGDLVQMQAKYHGLLEAAPDAMLVVNPRGEIVLLNVQAEKQFGYLPNELIGQKVKDIIPEGFAERLIADSARAAAGRTAQQIDGGVELSGLRKDGSEFPIEIMLSPLESAEGTSDHSGNSRRHGAQRCGRASGADGRQVSRPTRGCPGCDGGGERERVYRPGECSGGETVRIPAG